MTSVWALSDGRAGNESQARGLAEAIARRHGVAVRVLRAPLRAWAARLPAPVLAALPAWPFGMPYAALAPEGRGALAPPWPEIVVSAGRRIAPISAALRRDHGLRVVHLLDPKMRPDRFDALVVPAHDTLRGATVLTTLGALNALRPPEDPRPTETPTLAVLIGGPSRSAEFTDADTARLAEHLIALSEHFRLVVTASRRTPPTILALLRAHVPGITLWAPGSDAPNPYPAMLWQADAVLVTADSVNMASEAAATGRPVHVFPITRLAPKLVAFHDALVAQGASRAFEGSIEHWTYAPLREADRIADALISMGIVPPAPSEGSAL